MSITVLTAMSGPPRRFDVFTGTGRRRSFTAAEKAAFVAESYAGEDSVCGVARRHGLSSFRLFTWRRLAQPRHSCETAEPPLFVPVTVASEPEVSPSNEPRGGSKPRRRRRRSEGASIKVEIDGVVVRVGRHADAGAITAVVGALITLGSGLISVDTPSPDRDPQLELAVGLPASSSAADDQGRCVKGSGPQPGREQTSCYRLFRIARCS